MKKIAILIIGLFLLPNFSFAFSNYVRTPSGDPVAQDYINITYDYTDGEVADNATNGAVVLIDNSGDILSCLPYTFSTAGGTFNEDFTGLPEGVYVDVYSGTRVAGGDLCSGLSTFTDFNNAVDQGPYNVSGSDSWTISIPDAPDDPTVINWGSATTTNRMLGSLNFGVTILIVFGIIGFSGYLWNKLGKRNKPWM